MAWWDATSDASTVPAFHHARNWQGWPGRRMARPSAARIGVMTHRVTLIPGDGIGPELAEAARRVLDASGVAFEWDVGRRRRGRDGRVRHAAPGARPRVDPPQPGRPQGPHHDARSARASGRSTSRCARRSACTRTSGPARSMKGLDTRYENVDLVIVRENTEDLYAGIEHRVGRDAAESIKIITREASERIARYAFEYAVAQRPPHGHGRAQGEHHEALRRPVPRELPDRRGRVRGPRRLRGPHRRQHVHAARPEARAVRRPRRCRTSTATSSATSRPGSSAAWASRRAPTSARRRPSSSRSTGPPRSTPARTRPTPRR